MCSSDLLNALRTVIHQSNRAKVVMILSGVSRHLLKQLERSRIAGLVGRENIRPNIDKALARAAEVLRQMEGGEPR